MIINLILLFILSQLLLGVYLWLKVRHLYKYPNLFGSPIFGNLYYFYRHLMLPSLHNFLDYFGKVSDKLGYDIFFTMAFGKLWIILSCPHLTKEISFNPHISDRPDNYGYINKVGKGILAYIPADNEWKTRRKELTQATKKNNIEGPFHEIFTKNAKKITEAIEEEHNPVDIYYHIGASIFNSANGTLFGLKNSKSADRSLMNEITKISTWLAVLFGNAVVGLSLLPFSGLIYKMLFSKTRKFIIEKKKEVVEQMERIKEDLQGQVNVRIPWSAAIAMRNEQLERPEKELEKELTEILIVAWETTNATTCGATAYLAIFPEMQEKVWEEQFQIFGDSERDPTPEDVKKMDYLERFLKESLRFLSPPILGRTFSKDLNLGGIEIPAGTGILFLLQKMKMDPRYWKHPEAFNPDRFVDEILHVPTCAYLTFGLGVRNCPGMGYAFYQMKIIISTIIRKYKLSTVMKFEELEYCSDVMNRITNAPLIHVEKRKTLKNMR